MSGEPVDVHAAAIKEALGEPSRMISFSKSGYERQHPGHVCVFNANVCLDNHKVWWGDLDLTQDEPKLLQLAAATGATVYALRERDGRFQQEAEPLLGDAVYSVTPSGHSRYEHAYLERAADGTLRRRPPPPETRKRLILTLGRPRLLRFWKHDRNSREQTTNRGDERTTLHYIGDRTQSTARSPLLILGHFRREGAMPWRGLELTWYPTPKKHAPRALLHLGFEAPRGRTGPYLSIVVHPGLEYRILCGLAHRLRRF